MPPPARAISSYGHAGDLALVLLGPPARERQVRVAVDEARAARRSRDASTSHVGAGVGLEAGDPAAVERHVAAARARSSAARSWRR